MKFSTDLVTAVLVKNGITPINVEVMTKCSLDNSIDDCSFNIYCTVSQLVGYLPGYIASFEGSVLAFDIELELKQLLLGSEKLCYGYESLTYVSVWIELHRDPQRRQAFLKSNFGLPDAQRDLANQLTSACDSSISQIASLWLLHMDEFMQYVRNKLAGDMLFILSLFDALHRIAVQRKRTQVIKTVTHGTDVLKIMLAPLGVESIDRHLQSTSPVWTMKSATDYIRRIQSYSHSGGRLGFVTCHHFRSGNVIRRSLPAYLRAAEHDGGRKQLNRLIVDTVVGRNKDIGLYDF